MISLNPLSLFSALLLCFPLALFFTFSSLHPPPPPPPPPPSPPPPSSLPPPSPPLSSPPTTTNEPEYVVDDEEDVELRRRAARASLGPPTGPKKVAFMFLTTAPLPFAPLWERFFNQSGARGMYNVYVHMGPAMWPENDPNSKLKSNFSSVFTGVFSGRVIPSSKPTARNTPTLVSAARRLLAHALLDDPNNYMFTLLSGACIPLHSFNFTYATLTSSNRSFIEILNNEVTAYSRWAARGEDAMLPEIPLDVFRIGSQFWSLTRQHARVVVEDVKVWGKFKLPCVVSGTCFPEENYFSTLLSMVDPGGVVPATLTNVNWNGSVDGHPRTYDESEVGPELIRWLREARPRYGDWGVNGSGQDLERWDPFLFARKFESSCVQPLLDISSDVLFKD